MKHHFGDSLDRNGDYWTIVPNRERYAYLISDLPVNNEDIKIITIGQNDHDWERIFTLPNLEELTLHEPSMEQLEGISRLNVIRRLRVTHARPKSIEFIKSMTNIEELVFEYVSRFSDLSPLRSLKKLKSLHLENLRRISEFDGLSGISSLKYLRIDGTLDWKQPISDFEFLKGLPSLEFLSLGLVINKSPYPALLPVLTLPKLQTIKIPSHIFSTEEYALLEAGLPHVSGATWVPCRKWIWKRVPLPEGDDRSGLPDETIRAVHPEVFIDYKGQRLIEDPEPSTYEFLGKGAGRVKCISPKAEARCAAFSQTYDAMKQDSKKLISQTCLDKG